MLRTNLFQQMSLFRPSTATTSKQGIPFWFDSIRWAKHSICAFCRIYQEILNTNRLDKSVGFLNKSEEERKKGENTFLIARANLATNWVISIKLLSHEKSSFKW